MSEIYKKVEFVVNPERDNGQGFVFGQDVNPGTTLADQRKLTGKRSKRNDSRPRDREELRC